MYETRRAEKPGPTKFEVQQVKLQKDFGNRTIEDGWRSSFSSTLCYIVFKFEQVASFEWLIISSNIVLHQVKIHTSFSRVLEMVGVKTQILFFWLNKIKILSHFN